MEHIRNGVYRLKGHIATPDQARILNSIVRQESDIETQELKMENYWLERIFAKHGIEDLLGAQGVSISQDFRARRVNYGLNCALRVYGIDIGGNHGD